MSKICPKMNYYFQWVNKWAKKQAKKEIISLTQHMHLIFRNA